MPIVDPEIWIVEDEELAASRLLRLLQLEQPDWTNFRFFDSVSSTVQAFHAGKEPDVLFLDIELADGHSFEIFKQVDVSAAVVFCTAYDQYALQAFEHNGLAYLLKPIDSQALSKALKRIPASVNSAKVTINYHALASAIQEIQTKQPSRLLIRTGQKLKSIAIDTLAYAHVEDGLLTLYLRNGDKHRSDLKLDQLQEQLDAKSFFRINRQTLIHYDSIHQMTAYSRARVKIDLQPVASFECLVSTERSADFKRWLGAES